jgi:hypothetical protein
MITLRPQKVVDAIKKQTIKGELQIYLLQTVTIHFKNSLLGSLSLSKCKMGSKKS